MSLRTGIIGAGIVSQNNHLPAVCRNPRTDLIAICDIDEDRVRESATQYGVQGYTDAEQMLNTETLDWVHITTPVDTHAMLATAAIEAGASVLIQKPAAMTVAELDEIEEAANEAGVSASVVHNWLFYPEVRAARRKISAGEIGEVRSVETTFAGEGRPDETYRGEWVFDLPGGDFEEGMPHPLYLTLGIGGYPRDDAVDVQTRAVDEYDYGISYDGVGVQYVTDDSTICSITFLSGSAQTSEIRIHGSEGSLRLDIPSYVLERHGREDGPYHFFEERLKRNRRDVRYAFEGLGRNMLKRGREYLEDRYDVHLENSPDGHYYLINETAKALENGALSSSSIERSRWTLTLMEQVREAATDTTADQSSGR